LFLLCHQISLAISQTLGFFSFNYARVGAQLRAFSFLSSRLIDSELWAESASASA
jgi:hypothetical protein